MRRLLAPLLASLSLTACSLHYDVTLIPEGDQLHRSTSVSPELEPAELAELRHTFGQPTNRGDANSNNQKAEPIRLHFFGSHAGPDWTDGFGGRGSWKTYDSPLGSTRCFLECLGGDTSALDDMLALQNGIDAVAADIGKELRTHLQGDPMLRPAIRLLNKRITPDSRDAAVLGWALMFSSKLLPDKRTTGTGPGRDRLQDHIQSRLQEAVIAFLWQRNWLTASEASLLSAELADPNDVMQRMVARALDFDMDGPWEQQLEAFMEQLQKIFTDKVNDELTETFINAVGSKTRLAVAWAATTAFLTNRSVAITLKSDSAPTTTNGIWTNGSILWELDTAPLAVGLTSPPLCWSATWAEPDVLAQQRALGHIGINGEELVAFCLLWSDASDSQRAAATDIIDSYANTIRGTGVQAIAKDMLAECCRSLSPQN
ncbi:MAG: hypothetical protein P8I91_04755 [Phycisphaerales bacterium]|nr:hypothetical protein [Phycisphaerales bacterium]